jgi:hypothetical protein
MRVRFRLASLGGVIALMAAGLVGAPVTAADCNNSSGTTVCAQGDVRGTHAPPPARPAYGPGFGFGCGYLCYGGGGVAIVLAP